MRRAWSWIRLVTDHALRLQLLPVDVMLTIGLVAVSTLEGAAGQRSERRVQQESKRRRRADAEHADNEQRPDQQVTRRLLTSATWP